jgi:hypothetical protein
LTIDYSNTTVSPGQLDRQKVMIFNSNSLWDEFGWDSQPWSTDSSEWQNSKEYYVSVTGPNTVQLFNDPRLLSPVSAAEFDYTAGSIMFLAEPFTFTKSIVSLYGKAWECQVSNNDDFFDSQKWTLVPSDSDKLNAADRIAVYYAPTANMPGRELRQLITGVEYPNNTYAGPSFTYESGWDDDPWDIDAFSTPQALTLSDYETLLQSPRFAYDAITNPTVYDVQGGEFGDGYGPEEMVAGLLTDELNFQVTTNENTNIDESLFKKIKNHQISSSMLLSHHNYIIQSEKLGLTQYYTIQGSYFMNQYLRNMTSYRDKNKYIENIIEPMWNLVLNSPKFEGDYYVYRFINNDSFLENLKILQDFVPVKFSSVISNLTLHGLAEFVEQFPNTPKVYNLCNDPPYLGVNVLDDQTKQSLAKSLLNSNIENKDRIVSSMMRPCSDQNRQQLSTYLGQFAQRRNLKLDIFPSSMLQWLNLTGK